MDNVNLSRIGDEIAEREEYLEVQEMYDELDELEGELNGEFFGDVDETYFSEGND